MKIAIYALVVTDQDGKEQGVLLPTGPWPWITDDVLMVDALVKQALAEAGTPTGGTVAVRFVRV